MDSKNEARAYSLDDRTLLSRVKFDKNGKFLIARSKLYFIDGKGNIVGKPITDQNIDGNFTNDDKYLLISHSCGVGVFDLVALNFVKEMKVCEHPEDVRAGRELTEGRLANDENRLFIFTVDDVEVYNFDVLDMERGNGLSKKSLIYKTGNEKGKAGTSLYQGDFFPGSTSINPSEKLIAGGLVIYQQPKPISVKGQPSVGWVRDFVTGKIQYQLTGQRFGIFQTEFSPDEKYLATRGDTTGSSKCSASDLDGNPPKSSFGDGTLALRDVKTGKILKKYSNACYGPVFSKNGKQLMYSDYQFRLHIIDTP